MVQLIDIFLLRIFFRAGFFDGFGSIKGEDIRRARPMNICELGKATDGGFADSRPSVGLLIFAPIEERDEAPIMLLTYFRCDHVIVALSAIDPDAEKRRCHRFRDRLGIVLTFEEIPHRPSLIGRIWASQQNLAGYLVPRTVIAKNIFEVRAP